MKDVIIIINEHVNECSIERIKVLDLSTYFVDESFDTYFPYGGYMSRNEDYFKKSLSAFGFFENQEDVAAFMSSLDKNVVLSKTQFYESLIHFLHEDYNIKCVVFA